MNTALENNEALHDINDAHERYLIIGALDRWIRQRPGLEFGNYGDVSAYRSEMRSITKDLHDARTLLAAVNWRTSIDAAALKEAFRAYSGRLTWDSEKQRLDYCTGQYWPTEYRRAACAVLASALWAYQRDNLKPDPDCRPGDVLRAHFRKEFGRRIANRWFN